MTTNASTDTASTEPASTDTGVVGREIDTSDLVLEQTPDASYGSTGKTQLRTALVHINGNPFYFVEPDAGVQQDLEEAQDTRTIFRLLAERFWTTAMRDAIDSLSREDAIDMIDTITAKFDIDESVMSKVAGGRNRRERRAARGGRGRGRGRR